MSATDQDNVRKIFANIVDLWEARRPGPGLLPARADFDMTDFMDWIGWVSIYEIEYGDPIRFKIRLAGTQVTKIEQADNTGRYLDEVFPPDKHPLVYPPYFEALEIGGPVYLQRDVPTKSGVAKTMSKLVLPVAEDGIRPNKFINILHYAPVSHRDEIDGLVVI
ncbi:PAS domain-containing protein [Hwanghaeella grinnelliae]|uniref:PAS domain-containing protein n=1 Tax=Hwanghaeella grinnelliae TaxID=2500179 RepID=A0A3S2Y586_9PROT|nr:PAS domain-containing protein [Hwanghaeella grinnelliae]RVU38868.1 PAS domain-containing protein [Hwanghaeella grinnelliae]